jgi:GTPase involved in cell partitioning and DNA repair
MKNAHLLILALLFISCTTPKYEHIGQEIIDGKVSATQKGYNTRYLQKPKIIIMSKLDPKTREQAFAYQFEDDVKMLHSMSLLSKDGFKKHLAILQAHIDAYNDASLQKSCKDAEIKHKAQVKYMSDNFPTLGY